MQKVKHKIKDSFLFKDIISDEALALLNKIGNRHYYKSSERKIRVKRQDKKFKFWDKLIREKPGFNKRGDK